MLSARIGQVAPSMTLAISAKAAELRAQGQDVIALSAGEPDFKTPDFICEAAIQAIHAGHTHYTPVDGTADLKAAIVHKFARDNHLTYNTSEVMASVGAKQICYNLAQVVLDEGDETVIFAPYWVSYPDIVKLAGGAPRIVETTAEDNFKVQPAALDAALTDKTQLVFLNSPSNPTGAIYSAEELSALAEVLRRYPNVVIASDDIYEHLRYVDKPFVNLVNVAPDLKARVVIINGVSKAYAMTGWRIGIAAGSAELIGAMRKLQGQSTSNPCAIAQAAATEALNAPITVLADMVAEFNARRAFVEAGIADITGRALRPIEGAFYAFVDVRHAMKAAGVASDIDYAQRLLESEMVAVVPGASFGAPGFLRLSFATNTKVLGEALARIQRFVGKTA